MLMRRLEWRLLPAFLIVIVVCSVSIAFLVSDGLNEYFLEHLGETLLQDAKVAAEMFDPLEPESECKRLSGFLAVRVDIYSSPSQSLCRFSTSNLVNDIPEVEDAWADGVSYAKRNYAAAGEEILSVAFAPTPQTGPVFRISDSTESIPEALSATSAQVWWASLVSILLGALLSLALASRLRRPIERLMEGAKIFSTGNLNFRIRVAGASEFAELAYSLNQMAAELATRLQDVTDQRNELSAVLTAMDEAIIVLSPAKLVMRINKVAAERFGLTHADAIGRPLLQIIRSADLDLLLEDVLSSDESISGSVSIRGDKGLDRNYSVRGARFKGMQDDVIGALLILTDVTEIRRLEGIRTDFVANVSHELRTPVTSIKGFVETLQDGALEDRDAAQRFLGIIARHTDRLSAIIDDLLDLSRLEQDDAGAFAELKVESVYRVIENAVNLQLPVALTQNIDLDFACDENLTALINSPLLEQALINLVSNAIKYGGVNGKVRVSAVASPGNRVLISVRDWGPGIAREHIPRLFERFYRADKARSREIGGTGLGLAIVKHVVRALGGTVTVESTLGQGSEFIISLRAE